MLMGFIILRREKLSIEACRIRLDCLPLEGKKELFIMKVAAKSAKLL